MKVFLVGLISFALGGFVGISLTTLAMLAYVEARKHLEAGESAPKTLADSSPRPVFEIPITLNADRVVEVGMSQALQEDAARIARWN